MLRVFVLTSVCLIDDSDSKFAHVCLFPTMTTGIIGFPISYFLFSLYAVFCDNQNLISCCHSENDGFLLNLIPLKVYSSFPFREFFLSTVASELLISDLRRCRPRFLQSCFVTVY